MWLKNLCRQARTQGADQALRIWLGLMGLTLLSLLVAESDHPSVMSTLLVCGIVLLKGRWVIDHFMGLKHSTPSVRWIISVYFYLMTVVIGFSTVYSQGRMSVPAF